MPRLPDFQAGRRGFESHRPLSQPTSGTALTNCGGFQRVPDNPEVGQSRVEVRTKLGIDIDVVRVASALPTVCTQMDGLWGCIRGGGGLGPRNPIRHDAGQQLPGRSNSPARSHRQVRLRSNRSWSGRWPSARRLRPCSARCRRRSSSTACRCAPRRAASGSPA
jgi:hypothetical protein